MNKRAKKQKAIIFVIVLILALIFVYPLFLIVMNSVKPLAQILTKPLSWPDVFQIENYVKAFKEVNVLHVMKNTAVLTIGSVAGITLLAAMTAYWTFRYQTKYSKVFETFVILSMLIPFPDGSQCRRKGSTSMCAVKCSGKFIIGGKGQSG